MATACLPEQHRPVVPQPTGFSKSALEISRSFAPPRMSVQTRWGAQSFRDDYDVAVWVYLDLRRCGKKGNSTPPTRLTMWTLPAFRSSKV
jgi:hypothetical protein